MTEPDDQLAKQIGHALSIDLKHYFERVIFDQKTFFERLFAEHDKRHEREDIGRQEALDRALTAVDLANKLAHTEVLRRLTELNHAHEQAREKERDFISRDLHGQDIKSLDNRVTAINNSLLQKLDDRDKTIDGMQRELSESRGRQLAWTAALAVAFSIITVVSRFL